MGEHLYHTEPVVRAVLDQCDAVLREARGTSLLDVMFGRAGDLSEQAWTQPAIFAIECALTALWKSVGITPSVVLGHSLGELAAAQAAGVFSIEEGVRFAAARGELTATLPGGGAMAAIFADVSQVESALERTQRSFHRRGTEHGGIQRRASGGERSRRKSRGDFRALPRAGHSGQPLAHHARLPQRVGRTDAGQTGCHSLRE